MELVDRLFNFRVAGIVVVVVVEWEDVVGLVMVRLTLAVVEVEDCGRDVEGVAVNGNGKNETGKNDNRYKFHIIIDFLHC